MTSKRSPAHPVGTLALEFKFAEGDDAAEGKFTGYGSVYGNIDQAGDVMAQGSFKKSISDRKSSGEKFPILWQHDPGQPIGVIDEIKEDRTGLQIEVSLNLETAKGREAYALMKQGAVKGLSVGFQIVKRAFDDKGIRTITEAKLWEVSIVTFPCNTSATIQQIKSADEAAATEIPIEDVLEAIEKASLPNSVSKDMFSSLVDEMKALVKSAREDDDLEREYKEALAVTSNSDDEATQAADTNDDEPLDETELLKSLSTLLHSINRKD